MIKNVKQSNCTIIHNFYELEEIYMFVCGASKITRRIRSLPTPPPTANDNDQAILLQLPNYDPTKP